MNEPDRRDDERFAEWVDGCMSSRDRDRFEAELRVNAKLRTDLAEYQRTVDVVRKALQEPVAHEDVDVSDRVLAAIAGGAAPVRAPLGRRRTPLLAAVLLAAALLGVTVWIDSVWISSPQRIDVATAPDDRVAVSPPPARSELVGEPAAKPREPAGAATPKAAEPTPEEMLRDESRDKDAASPRLTERMKQPQTGGGGGGRGESGAAGGAADRTAPDPDKLASGKGVRTGSAPGDVPKAEEKAPADGFLGAPGPAAPTKPEGAAPDSALHLHVLTEAPATVPPPVRENSEALLADRLEVVPEVVVSGRLAPGGRSRGAAGGGAAGSGAAGSGAAGSGARGGKPGGDAKGPAGPGAGGPATGSPNMQGLRSGGSAGPGSGKDSDARPSTPSTPRYREADVGAAIEAFFARQLREGADQPATAWTAPSGTLQFTPLRLDDPPAPETKSPATGSAGLPATGSNSTADTGRVGATMERSWIIEGSHEEVALALARLGAVARRSHADLSSGEARLPRPMGSLPADDEARRKAAPARTETTPARMRVVLRLRLTK